MGQKIIFIFITESDVLVAPLCPVKLNRAIVVIVALVVLVVIVVIVVIIIAIPIEVVQAVVAAVEVHVAIII